MNLSRLELVETIAKVAGHDGWTRWERVVRQMRIRHDKMVLVKAWAELHASDLIEQNRTQTSVRLSPIGHQTVREGDAATSGPVWISKRFWVYYSQIHRPHGPRRLIIHDSDCPHCQDGQGHGGHARHVNPQKSRLYLPRVAWIGPFSCMADANQWCMEHKELQEYPEKCTECFGLQK